MATKVRGCTCAVSKDSDKVAWNTACKVHKTAPPNPAAILEDPKVANDEVILTDDKD